MIDLSQWRAVIGSWSCCQVSSKQANGCYRNCSFEKRHNSASIKSSKSLALPLFTLLLFSLLCFGCHDSNHPATTGHFSYTQDHFTPDNFTASHSVMHSLLLPLTLEANIGNYDPVYFSELLILLSGDVELNPGPRSGEILQSHSDILTKAIIDCFDELISALFAKSLIPQETKSKLTSTIGLSPYQKASELTLVLQRQLESSPKPDQYLKELCEVLKSQGHQPLTDTANKMLLEQNPLEFPTTQSQKQHEIRYPTAEEEKEMDDVLTNLRDKFPDLLSGVKEAFKHEVKNNPTLLENVQIWIESRMGWPNKPKYENIEDVFTEIHPYYDFLDCELIVRLSEKFLQGSIVTEFRQYKKDAHKFRSSVTVRYLNESLKSIYKEHLTNLANMPHIVIHLYNPWFDSKIDSLELLIKHLLPKAFKQSLLKHITILSGSVVIKCYILNDTADNLMKHIQKKLQFMHLVGVFRLFVNNHLFLNKDKKESFAFQSALYKAVVAGHNEAVEFLLKLKVIDVNDGCPLIAACIGETDNSHIVELLLEAGADPNVQRVLPSIDIDTTLTMDNFTALMLASRQGHLNSVQVLLHAKADPNIQCSNTGFSALTLAVIATSHGIVQELLRAGANTNVTIKTPIKNESTMVEVLLTMLITNVQPDTEYVNNDRPNFDTNDTIKTLQLLLEAAPQPENDHVNLAIATSFGMTEVVDLLLHAGYDPSKFVPSSKQEILKFDSGQEWNALMIACDLAHTEMVKLFLKRHANPNIKAEDNTTALIIACRGKTDNSQIVELLLEAGADPNVQIKSIIDPSWDGATALMFCIMLGHLQSIQLLLKANADPNLQHETSEATALSLAIMLDHPRTNKYASNDDPNELMEYLSNTEWFDSEQDVRMIASDNYQTEIVRLLLNSHADPNYQANGCYTALMSACCGTKTEIVQLLLEAGADPNIQIVSHSNPIIIGGTALMLACYNGSLEIIQLLLKANADPNLKCNKFGLTALTYAIYAACPEVVQELIKAGANTNVTYTCSETDDDIPINLTPSQHCVYMFIIKRMNVNNLLAEKMSEKYVSPQQAITSLNGLIPRIKDENIIAVLQLLLEATPEIAENDDPVSLMIASFNGNAQVAELLIRKGYNPYIPSKLFHLLCNIDPNQSDWNSLMFACYPGHTQVVEILLASKNVLKAEDGCNALFMASLNGYTQIVELLLRKKVNPNTKINNKFNELTPLMAACLVDKEKSEIVQLLLEAGADPNVQIESDLKNYGCTTALMFASNNGHLKSVRLLLGANADPNIIHPVTRYTALAGAISSVNPEIVKALLEAGANVNPGTADVNIRGRLISFTLTQMCTYRLLEQGTIKVEFSTIKNLFEVIRLIVKAIPNPDDDAFGLMIASMTGCVQVVDLLIEAGYHPMGLNSSKLCEVLSIENSDNLRYPSLIYACIYGHSEVVKSLIKAVDNPNVQEVEGETPLIIASQYGHFDTVKTLLENGADPNICDNDESNALHHALLFDITEINRLNIVQILLRGNVNVNSQDTNGITALMVASMKGHNEIISLLLQDKADPNVIDNKGMTALMHACRNGHSEAAKLLLMTNNINPSLTDYNKLSSLLHAALGHHKDVINVLLSYSKPKKEELILGLFLAFLSFILIVYNELSLDEIQKETIETSSIVRFSPMTPNNTSKETEKKRHPLLANQALQANARYNSPSIMPPSKLPVYHDTMPHADTHAMSFFSQLLLAY